MDFDPEGKRLVSAAAEAELTARIVVWDVEADEKGYEKVVDSVRGLIDARFVDEDGSIAVFASGYSAIWDPTLERPIVQLPIAIRSEGFMAEWPGKPHTFLVRDREGVTFHSGLRRYQNNRIEAEGYLQAEIFEDVGRAALYGSGTDVVLVTTKTGAVVQKLGGHKGSVHHVHHFGDREGTLTFSRGRDVRVWKNHQHTIGFEIVDGIDRESSWFDTSPDGRQILRAYRSWKFRETRKEVYALNNAWRETEPIAIPSALTNAEFGPNNQIYGYYREGGRVVRWDPAGATETTLLESGKLYQQRIRELRPTARENTVLVQVYDPDTRRSSVFLTDPDDSSKLTPFIVHPRSIWRSVAMSGNARLIAAADAEKIVVWDVIDRQAVLSKPRVDKTDRSPLVSISREGEYVAVYNNKGIQIWSTETGELVQSATEKFGNAYVQRVGFVNASNLLLAVKSRGWRRDVRLILWNWKTGAVVQDYPIAGGRVFQLSIAPGGRYFLTHGGGSAAFMWDIESGAILRQWHNAGQIEFSPSGDSVVCICAEKLTVYPILPRGDALIDLARENLPSHRNTLSDEERRDYDLLSGI